MYRQNVKLERRINLKYDNNNDNVTKNNSMTTMDKE